MNFHSVYAVYFVNIQVKDKLNNENTDTELLLWIQYYVRIFFFYKIYL
jgi:hypothetical protein